MKRTFALLTGAAIAIGLFAIARDAGDQRGFWAHTAIITVARRCVGAPRMLRTAPLQQTTTIGGAASFSSHARVRFQDAGQS
jgi:hypothetical protein